RLQLVARPCRIDAARAQHVAMIIQNQKIDGLFGVIWIDIESVGPAQLAPALLLDEEGMALAIHLFELTRIAPTICGRNAMTKQGPLPCKNTGEGSESARARGLRDSVGSEEVARSGVNKPHRFGCAAHAKALPDDLE